MSSDSVTLTDNRTGKTYERLAQWQEMRADPEQKTARPRQLYLGSGKRAYLAMGKREETPGRRP